MQAQIDVTRNSISGPFEKPCTHTHTLPWECLIVDRKEGRQTTLSRSLYFINQEVMMITMPTEGKKKRMIKNSRSAICALYRSVQRAFFFF